ncbi:type II toxin-antitoxin system RelE/ParE family toxin [Brachyspira intermedia]|uniref:hypothetical protein n=1 Tax=Brachyspira intermedia TaxID=84377 RepID=UPI00300500E0
MNNKSIFKKYFSFNNTECLISNDVMSLVIKNPRKKIIMSKIKYLAKYLFTDIVIPAALYKKIENNIWEIKHHDIRIFCFRKNNNWFLYHAMIKKTDKIKDEIYIIRKKYNELNSLA